MRVALEHARRCLALLELRGDAEECGKVYTINVAATDAAGNIAEFSNRGKCADVFVPGVDIITGAPEDFLMKSSGTSFSSPLFVRYLTQSGKRSRDYSDIYRRYKRSQHSLSSNQIPTELILESKKRIDTFSLTDAQRRQPKKRFERLRLPFGLR